jgi:hypothetical protein
MEHKYIYLVSICKGTAMRIQLPRLRWPSRLPFPIIRSHNHAPTKDPTRMDPELRQNCEELIERIVHLKDSL